MAQKQNKKVYDLGSYIEDRNRAIFLPSISSIYASYTSKTDNGGRDTLSTDIHPAGNLQSLDWFTYHKTKQDDWLYYYPYSLYSAGHARLDPADSDVKEAMVQKRDRSKTIVVGDSGGFQVATGVLRVNWEDPNDLKKMRERILRWLEHTADYAMILDFPTGSCHIPPARESITIYDYLKRKEQGINDKRYKWYFKEKNGDDVKEWISKKDPLYKKYEFTFETHNLEDDFFPIALEITYENNEYFQQNRNNYDMKFLNVVQGQTPQQIRNWVAKMKDFDFEGWSFSSTICSNFFLMLHAVNQLYRHGSLAPKKSKDGRELPNDWLHLLGNAKIKASLGFTMLQRKLREHVNPDMKVSFDAASAFLCAARGNLYVGWNQRDLTLLSRSFLDSAPALLGSTEKFNLRSDVLDDATHVEGKAYRPTSFGLKPGLYDKNIHPKLDEFKKYYSTSYDPETGDVITYSPMVEKLTYGDVCVLSDRKVPARVGNIGQHVEVNDEHALDMESVKKSRTYDCLSYIYLMNHNVYTHATAIYQAHDLYDKEGLSAFSTNVSSDLKKFEFILDQMFDQNVDFDQVLADNEIFLTNFVRNRSKETKAETTFDELFFFDEKETSIDSMEITLETDDADEQVLDLLENLTSTPEVPHNKGLKRKKGVKNV